MLSNIFTSIITNGTFTGAQLGIATVTSLICGIGAGVAVAGAFSLVRFRSAPGKGQEITSIFLAMAVGLATGMGYVGVAVLFSVVVSLINLLLNVLKFG